jgi:hypothetical protein
MNLPILKPAATVRGGKRLLHAEPYEHDGGKRDADAKAQCVDCGGCGVGQSIASLGDPIQHSHTSPQRSQLMSVSQGLRAAVVGRRDVHLVGVHIDRGVLKSSLEAVLLLFLRHDLLQGEIGVDLVCVLHGTQLQK